VSGKPQGRQEREPQPKMILGDDNQARPNNANDPATGTALQARRPIPGFSFIQVSFPGPTTTPCR
jgi:hypothetical protein